MPPSTTSPWPLTYGRAVRAQPRGGLGHLLRACEAPHRRALADRVDRTRRGGEHLMRHRRVHDTGQHRVHADALARVLERRGAGQAEDRVLGRHVGGDLRRRDHPEPGRRVDDRAAARPQHRPDLLLHAHPRPAHVDVHDRLELLVAVVDERLHPARDAGVVERAVQAPVALRRQRDERDDVLPPGDVRRAPRSVAARLRDEPRGLGECLLGTVAEHDLRALPGERQSRGAADPAGRAGDHGDLALEQGRQRTLLMRGNLPVG